VTLAAPQYPLSVPDALTALRDALGGNYGGRDDDATLTRALGVDAVWDGTAAHARPWATAARLIRENTEYEVDKGIAARIDRKLGGLESTQAQADAQAGIAHLIPGRDATSWPPAGGAAETKAVF